MQPDLEVYKLGYVHIKQTFAPSYGTYIQIVPISISPWETQSWGKIQEILYTKTFISLIMVPPTYRWNRLAALNLGIQTFEES